MMIILGPLLAASFAVGEPYTPKEVSVIDGDTLKIDGVIVRISNIDAPESGARAQCDAERFLAVQATRYAKELAEQGPLIVWSEGKSDRYRRPLVRVSINGTDWGAAMVDASLAVKGTDWGALMIEASLAVSWEGKRHAWCVAHQTD